MEDDKEKISDEMFECRFCGKEVPMGAPHECKVEDSEEG